MYSTRNPQISTQHEERRPIVGTRTEGIRTWAQMDGEHCMRCIARGAAGPIPFHAFRRACAFYSWYRLRPTWWAPEKSKDIAACARSFRVRQFAWLIEATRRSSAIGTEVSAERHKSDCRSTAGEDQQGLRVCGLEGRRSMQ